MALISRKVMVLCPHLGSLLNYSVLLNRLGIFNVNLCADFEDVQQTLVQERQYDLFIYDGPNPDIHTLAAFRSMSDADSFSQLALAGTFNKADRYQLLEWAWNNRVPLLQLLDKPFTLVELREVIDSLVSYELDQQHARLDDQVNSMCEHCTYVCIHGHWRQPEDSRAFPLPPCSLP